MPYGILRRAEVADVVALATEPESVTLYPALTVEPQATVADVRCAASGRRVTTSSLPAMSRDDDRGDRSGGSGRQAVKRATIIGVCAWSRTYRSRAVTFSRTDGAQQSRNGIRIVPDQVAASWPAERLIPAIEGSSAGTASWTTRLQGLSGPLRNAPRRTYVAMQLEYPRLNSRRASGRCEAVGCSAYFCFRNAASTCFLMSP